MPDFETTDCEQCGESFRVVPGSNAAEKGYCSPGCEVRGRDS